MARHDPARSGSANGTSNLVTPAVYWRYYVGGSMSIDGGMLVDLDRDGEDEALFVSGGQLVLGGHDGLVRWVSKPLRAVAIVAVADLDGDSVLDIVVRSSSRVFVLDAATGQTVWAEAEGEMGTIGGVRVTDVDGDGLADVWVQECRCCQVKSGETGFAYSFADGFSSWVRLWEQPSVYCGGNRSMLVADITGDGQVDVTLGDAATISVLSGATGNTLAVSPDLGTWVALSLCQAVNVDQSPGKELVCALNTPLETAGSGHRVFALKYVDVPMPRLELLWQRNIGAQDGKLDIGPGFVSDLDGDGSLEVIVSGTNANDSLITRVLDAGDGSVLASLRDNSFAGTARLEAPDQALVVTEADDTTSAWAFNRATSKLDFRWSLADRRVLSMVDWQLAADQPQRTRLAAIDLNADGLGDLFTLSVSSPNELYVYSGAGGAAALHASLELQAETQPLAVWQTTQSTFSLALAGSDGYLRFLDRDLNVAPERLRFGGHYSAGAWLGLPADPVVAALDGDPAQLLVTDSRKSLNRLDANGATNAGPPQAVWKLPRTSGPAVVAGLDGKRPGIMCRRRNRNVTPAVDEVAAVRGDGTLIWSKPVGDEIFQEPLPAKLDADSTPDVVVQWGSSADKVVRTNAYSGADGSLLWTNAVDAGPTRFPSGASITDWNGDGRDDVVHQFYGTRVISGATSNELATGGPSTVAYFMPTVVDVDNDNEVEVTLHGGFSPARTLEKDLSTTVWVSPNDDRPFPYGAISKCGSDSVLVEGSLARPSMLTATRLSGANAGQQMTTFLADGRQYDTLDKPAGLLTSTYAHSNLTGTGEPSAVVGSDDGWLYAVNPCTLALQFSMHFGAPVGAVAFGDTDGDGLDNMVVSVADGYVYGVANAPIQAPSWVFDTDAPYVLFRDVDETESLDTRSALWAPVEGATGYQVAVVRPDGGGFVTSPEWIDVGSTTQITLTGLSLVAGQRYIFAVRALTDEGPSPDTLSDGVLVIGAGGDAGPGDGEPAGGCCDSGGSNSGPFGTVLLALATAIMLMSRRRRFRR